MTTRAKTAQNKDYVYFQQFRNIDCFSSQEQQILDCRRCCFHEKDYFEELLRGSSTS